MRKHKEVCKHGHDLTGANAHLTKEGWRRCRECGRVKAQVKRQRHPLYDTWYTMIRRCTKPDFKDWHLYGGKTPPITVCRRWLDSYGQFVADMAPRPEGRTLERIDSNGPYSLANCTWASPTEQARNTSRTVQHEIEGVRHPLGRWCEIYHMDYPLVAARILDGWTVKEAVSIPVGMTRSGRPWRKRRAANHHYVLIPPSPVTTIADAVPASAQIASPAAI